MFRLQAFAFAYIIQTLPKSGHFRFMLLFQNGEVPADEIQKLRSAIYVFMKVIGAAVCEFSRNPFENVDSVGQPGGFPIFGRMNPNTFDCPIDVLLEDLVDTYDFETEIFREMTVVRSDMQEVSIGSLENGLKNNKLTKRRRKKKQAKALKKTKETNVNTSAIPDLVLDDQVKIVYQQVTSSDSEATPSTPAAILSSQAIIDGSFN